jgi:DNA end-binding protein Ku
MPRAIWSGAISFGLVNVPVRMYSAIQENDLHFHYVHTTDGSRIGYEKVCKAEAKRVPDEEIAKAFEWTKGEYVLMSPEDFEAAAAREHSRTIEIRDFVDHTEIDPVYFERTYVLGPADGSERVYNLLARAMEESGLAGIVKYVMRDKQNLGCVRVREGVITLEKMYFAAEVRPVDEIRPENAPAPDEQELEMAVELIGRLRTDFEPERYEDTYRDTLCEIIKAKREGQTVRAPEASAAPPPDLMAALKASLERTRGGDGARGGNSGARGRTPAAGSRDELQKLSRDELYDRARTEDVSGRSAMSKEELVAALSR